MTYLQRAAWLVDARDADSSFSRDIGSLPGKILFDVTPPKGNHVCDTACKFGSATLHAAPNPFVPLQGGGVWREACL